jgi:hypothetical protein
MKKKKRIKIKDEWIKKVKVEIIYLLFFKEWWFIDQNTIFYRLFIFSYNKLNYIYIIINVS